MKRENFEPKYIKRTPSNWLNVQPILVSVQFFLKQFFREMIRKQGRSKTNGPNSFLWRIWGPRVPPNNKYPGLTCLVDSPPKSSKISASRDDTRSFRGTLVIRPCLFLFSNSYLGGGWGGPPLSKLNVAFVELSFSIYLTRFTLLKGEEKLIMVSNHVSKWGTKKNPPTFHYTGWLIGILIMVY